MDRDPVPVQNQVVTRVHVHWRDQRGLAKRVAQSEVN